ncbi:conserved protein, unknown function [Plasmodium reichenowi]|uniref:ELM2 domain-containing protein n=1 Tax=Plasmodium reichenowi TaxID=5854 RepID=A0A151LQX2_PLARE|nr:conserved protein, unknown function [Plasmodium reichenowi]KYO01598.1 conserved protein, unknown function [Plasmodium reichenowi]
MDDYNDKEVYISEEEEEEEQEQEHKQEQEQEQDHEQEQEQEHGIEKNNNEEKSDKRNGYYLEENHNHDVEEIHDDDDDVNHTYVYDNEKYVHKVEDNHLTDNDMIEEDEENDQKRDEDLNEEEEYEHDSNHNNIDIDESNKEESEAEQNLKKEEYDSVDEDKKDNLQKNVAYANTIIKGGRNLRNLNKSSTSFDKTKKEQNNNMNRGGTNFIKTLSDENNLQNNIPHGRRKRKVSKDLNLNNEYVYGTNLNFKHVRNVNDDIDEHEESENNHDQNNNEEINEHNPNDDNPIHNDDTNANNDDDNNNITNNNENVVKTNEKILNGKQTNLRGSHLKLKTNRTKKNKKLSNKLNRNIAKNVNKNNNGRYGNVGRAQASTTQGNEKKVHGTNDNAEYTTHNRGKNSTTTNFTNRHSRVTFNNNNEGTYYAGHNNNTSTSHGNRHNDPHEEAEPKKGKKKRVTEEGSKESGKINVGDSYQVSNLPNFFLCRSELMYKNYDTQENTNDQMCLSCSGLPCHCKVGEATLVYSPIMLERVRERCLKNRGYHKCVKNEIELSAYVQECAKSWKSNIDEWVPFSPEYAYKLLHYANYDPHKAISIMKSSEFSFRKIMDPPTRKYQNKWKPKDKREHISKNPFPSPLTIRTYLSKRHHNSGYHLR